MYWNSYTTFSFFLSSAQMSLWTNSMKAAPQWVTHIYIYIYMWSVSSDAPSPLLKIIKTALLLSLSLSLLFATFQQKLILLSPFHWVPSSLKLMFFFFFFFEKNSVSVRDQEAWWLNSDGHLLWNNYLNLFSSSSSTREKTKPFVGFQWTGLFFFTPTTKFF